MGFVWKFLVLTLLLASSASSHFNSGEEGFISTVISQKGLNFVKDFLIEKAVSTIIPLRLPDIEKNVNIILIGKVHVVLSDIVISSVDVESSDIRIGDTGVNILVTKATANMTMKWRYSYQTWLVDISDEGDSSVQVDGMNIGLTLGLDQKNGSLALSVLECGCHVEDISIHVHGGVSWLYQVVVDAFQGLIESRIEDKISQKIEEGVVKLDSSLRSLPREIPIADVAALNVTFVGSPVLYNSSIEVKINGLFTTFNKALVSSYYQGETEGSGYGESRYENALDSASRVLFNYRYDRIEGSVYCKDSVKMIEFALHENVLNSASKVLFEENYMHWTVDKIPGLQKFLNTAAWRWIIPRLYRQYPNDDMILNISVSSPPLFWLRDRDISATISADMIVDVRDLGEVIPVACISLEITSSFSPQILGKNLVGHVRLEDFTLTLKWSNIGRLHLYLLQKTIAGLIKSVLVSSVNLYLLKGIPLPSYQGIALQNAETFFNSSRVIMCSDITLTLG